MFTKIYSWCTSLGEKLSSGGENEEFVDYYTGYFEETSVCSTIFWTSLIIALVVALLYYFGVCNFIFNLAKRWVWLCVTVLVFAITFFTTIPQIVGHDAEDSEDSTKLFYTSHQIEADKLDGTEDEDMREEIQLTASQFREQFLPKEDSFMSQETLPIEMALWNAIYSIIFFIILSFIFKRFTTHGAAVPL